MTLEEYKFIYWMEFGHRMWGRGLGAYFALPLAVFAAAGFVWSLCVDKLRIDWIATAALDKQWLKETDMS